jgi:hypothetical protein
MDFALSLVEGQRTSTDSTELDQTSVRAAGKCMCVSMALTIQVEENTH